MAIGTGGLMGSMRPGVVLPGLVELGLLCPVELSLPGIVELDGGGVPCSSFLSFLRF